MCSLNKKARKTLYYNLAFAEANRFGLGSYHTMLLAYMVRRKMTHFDESIEVIIPKAQKWMGKNYSKKKHHLHLSTGRSMENLEMALEESDSIPEKLRDGKIISNTVIFLVKEVLDEVEGKNSYKYY